MVMPKNESVYDEYTEFTVEIHGPVLQETEWTFIELTPAIDWDQALEPLAQR
jgi:hypothetical protein